jgi:uncharacterized membrane protein YdbT with pleckstrin-like domain
MSSYIKNTLILNEEVIYEGKISIWSQIDLVIFGIILLPFFGIGLLCFVTAYIRYATTELAFTNKRVIAKFGFVRRSTIEITLSKVESIQVNQGVFGRIFDFGTLIISGAGTPQAPIPGISNPISFRRAFMEYQDSLEKN